MRDRILPTDWRETELGYLGSFFRGQGGTRADEEPNGLPCVRYGDLYTHHDCIIRSFVSSISPSSASSYSYLQSGDVVFAGSGETFEEIGKAAAYCGDSPAYAGADTIIFRPGPDLLPQFAGYAVNDEGANEHKTRMGQGSSVIHIGAEHLSRMRLRLPPIQQQLRIAEILSTIDAATEQTETLIAKTQQIKIGLMQDFFTRGVTADGKLRPPREEAPQLYKESPLGCIPKEWQTGYLADYRAPGRAHIKTGPFGSSLKLEHWVDDGVPVITIGALGEGEFIQTDLLHVSAETAAFLGDYRLSEGDIVFSRVADVGRSAVITAAERSWIMSSNLMRISLDVTRVVPAFLQSQLAYDSRVRTQIRANVNSGGREVANSATLNRLCFCWPGFTEQQRVVERFAMIENRRRCLAEELGKLRQVKAGLMRDLLTGHVPVTVDATPEAAKIAAANV